MIDIEKASMRDSVCDFKVPSACINRSSLRCLSVQYYTKLEHLQTAKVMMNQRFKILSLDALTLTGNLSTVGILNSLSCKKGI